MRNYARYIIVFCLFLPTILLAKGDGIGFWMEGTVTNISVSGNSIQLRLAGRFWFVQYPEGRTDKSLIEVNLERGASISVTQAEPFFAMSSDWRAGSIREKGALLKILRAAAETGREIKLEITDPQLAFGQNQSFSLINGAVIRATDADLR